LPDRGGKGQRQNTGRSDCRNRARASPGVGCIAGTTAGASDADSCGCQPAGSGWLHQRNVLAIHPRIGRLPDGGRKGRRPNIRGSNRDERTAGSPCYADSYSHRGGEFRPHSLYQKLALAFHPGIRRLRDDRGKGWRLDIGCADRCEWTGSRSGGADRAGTGWWPGTSQFCDLSQRVVLAVRA